MNQHSGITAIVAACAVLTACGGGGSSSSSATTGAEAAAQTVASNPNCAVSKLGAFYWEIGDQSGVLASGQAGSGAPTASTQMQIASASKWIYAAYAAEKLGSAFGSADAPLLNFTSGYTNLLNPTCSFGSDTVAACMSGSNGTQDPDTVGQFYYNSGHMQRHAMTRIPGMADMDKTQLGTEISAVLGVPITYTDVALAASGKTSAEDYRVFLRKILAGTLRIATMLDQDSVCASESACPSSVDYSPQQLLAWHYGLGHWIENDSASVSAGNVAYSSAGAFGFYPWVNQSRTLYGILARESGGEGQQGFESALCGAAVRRAYVTETVQTGL